MNIIREIQKRLFPKTLRCVYRKDILEYALKHHKYWSGENHGGLCVTLINAFDHYNIGVISINYYLPLFNNGNANILFNAKTNDFRYDCEYYWWPKGEWNTGRLDFLKWLFEQYKDNKTNLKEL